MAFRLKVGVRRGGYYIAAVAILYWFFIRQKRVSEKFEFLIDDAEPKIVWEYWADFSNYKKINPTVIDFEIDYEKGTYENWEYGVNYKEHLTRLPFTVNIHGRFIVTPQQKRGHFAEPFRIISEHDSCLWFFCTHTDGDMTFTLGGGKKNTKVSETVTFSSPIALTWYYLSEIRLQRVYISKQLKEIDFSTV